MSALPHNLTRRRLLAGAGLAATGLATAGLVSGCGNDRHAAGGRARLRVTVLTLVDSAPFMIALKKGWFRDAGLDIDLKLSAQSANALTQLWGGSLDLVAGANYVQVVSAAANTNVDPLVVVDGYQSRANSTGIVVRKDSNLHRPQDLAGKKIAFSLKGSVTTLTASIILETYGVHAYTEEEIAFPNMLTALTNKSVDAAYLVEPFLTQALGKKEPPGMRMLLDPLEGPTADWPLSGNMSSRSAVEHKPRAMRALQRVLMRAQTYASDNRSAVEQVLAAKDFTRMPPNVARLITLGAWLPELAPVRLQRVIDEMKQHHMLDAAEHIPDAKDLIWAPATHSPSQSS